ncbi:MAG: hypothetical protein LBT20_01395 [Clostridiales bacterium]|jgi:hypothetical protein|nr:hypothetical protein [Clostridiales bacterium]
MKDLIEEVEEEIAKINAYLSKNQWMDFEIKQVNSAQIVMIGSIDLLLEGYESLEIIIDQPTYMASNISEWHTDTSKEVFFCESISDGYYKFTVLDDNGKLNIYIGTSIKVKILKPIE